MAKKDETTTTKDSDDDTSNRGSTTVVVVLTAPISPRGITPPKVRHELRTTCRNTSLIVAVVTEDGKGVAGARVSARWQPHQGNTWIVRPPQLTDAGGKTRFSALPLKKGQAASEEFIANGAQGLSGTRLIKIH
ncbi:MAG: hypothetical protein AABZ53_09600 [Planctomycetota bacterium]